MSSGEYAHHLLFFRSIWDQLVVTLKLLHHLVEMGRMRATGNFDPFYPLRFVLVMFDPINRHG